MVTPAQAGVASLDPPMKIISLRNISKTYVPDRGSLPVPALRNINLEIEEGTIFSIIGPNGAGKTSLISILTTLLIPDEGVGEVCGFDLLRESGKIREVVNVTSGNANFTDIFSVAENLNYYGMLYGLTASRRRKKIEQLIEMFHLQAHRNTPFNRLSTGTKQRLALAKSLINDPKVLFLDEPTTGLDPHISESIRKNLKEMNRQEGLTIVLTTHNMDEAEFLSDHISFLQSGKIIAEGNSRKLKSGILWGDIIRVRYEGCIVDPDKLTSQEGVLEMNVSDQLVSFTVDNHEKRLDPLVRALISDENFILHDIELIKPELEDVFLELAKAPH
jgi:ABC-2 type transport system ATP-binding protein